jgi:hypothetical protein
MSFAEKAKRKVAVEQLFERNTSEKSLEELEFCARHKKVWARALQKSRGNEKEAAALYLEYRAQAIKDEVEIAKALLEEHSAIIIQGYISKMEQRDFEKQKRQHNTPGNEISPKYLRKKCYKCRKMVVLAMKTCPSCNCNSFVFCG